ncbi:MAG: carboxyl-terminal processing protease [Chthoniobacter sp.]|jgi:hypothetical protein|nr:carboxyl-terminal processing protease [Chthoniobacter sp.]
MTSSVVPALAALLFASTAPLLAQAPPAPKPDAPPADTKPAEPAEKAAAPAGNALVDSLTEAELDEVITLLKNNFIKPEALSDKELKRATVQGALARLAPGAALAQAPAGAAAESSPFRSEILDGRIGYVRLGSTSAANVGELDSALAKFAEKACGAVVLDLRATPSSSDFEQMAEVCRRFAPKGKVLFTVRKSNVKQEQVLTSKEEPKFRGIIVVLVDRNTAGNAEVIAAVLRTHSTAMIIGQQTKGEAVEFTELPLASGKLLRVAVAEVALPDKSGVFPGGVKPDVIVDVPQETAEAVLKQGLEKGVTDLVFETERPRMNEASLVSGANPEFDAAHALQKSKGERPKAPLRDAILQRAVDFITTVKLYQQKTKPAK